MHKWAINSQNTDRGRRHKGTDDILNDLSDAFNVLAIFKFLKKSQKKMR